MKDLRKKNKVREGCLVLLSLLLFHLDPMMAQIVDNRSDNGNSSVLDDLYYDFSRMRLANAENGRALTPEQIMLLGEHGFDTKNYYAQCKQMRLVRDLSSAGLIACGVGGVLLFAWTDHDESGNVVYKNSRLIAGGTCMGVFVGGMIGLAFYLKDKSEIIVGEAEKACLKIGPTESGVGLSFHFKWI